MPARGNTSKRPSNDQLEKEAPPPKRPNQGQDEASRSQTARGGSENGDQHSHISNTPEPTPIELQRRLEDQERQLACLSSAVNTKFEQQGRQLGLILQHLQGNQGTHQDEDEDDERDQQVVTPVHKGNAPPYPSSPLQFVKNAYPWVKQPLLQDIVGLKLDIKDLPKLLPTRYRPKSRVATSNLTGRAVLLDPANSTTTIIEPDNPTHDKDIPDMKVLLSIVNVYAGIRGAWDHLEGTQMGPAINAYATQLAFWDRFDNYNFKDILLYFLDHFEKHQESTDPKSWITIDNHLHALHMRNPSAPTTLAQSPAPPGSPTKHPGSPSKSHDLNKPICRNYNMQNRGCTPNCPRRHICILCASDGQKLPVFQCTRHANN
jgi:hypothetical protein